MKNKINVGTTSLLCRVVIYDSTAAYPKPLTGLVYNSSGLTCYYIRAGSASATAVTLATATVGTFTSGGFKEVDSTNMPGVYEIGIPNAALASGATSVVMVLKGGTNMVQVSLEIELDLINYQDGVRAGLTAIPNVNFGTTGGLLGYGTGTGQVSPTSGNVSLITSQNPSVQNGTAQAGAASTITLAAGALATDSIYVGSVITIQSGTGVGQSRVITGYVGSTKVATVNSAWQTNPDATSVYSVFGEFVPTADSSLRVTVGSNADKTGYSLTQAFPTNFSSLSIDGSGLVGLQSRYDRQVRVSTCQSGSTTTAVKLDASASATTDFYKGHLLSIYAGTGAGGASYITAYNGTTKVATVAPALPTAPAAGDSYAIAYDSNYVDANGYDLASVQNYATGQDPATLVLVTPANKLVTSASGYVTVVTNNDKTGYSLTQTFPTNFSSLAITGGGAVTAGTVSDKTGYALTAGEHTSIASDAQTGLTAQGYTTTRAGYLDTLNGLVAAIWANATRTLTAAVDSAGVTTLLSRLTQVILFDSSGNVRASAVTVLDKSGYSLASAPLNAQQTRDAMTLPTTSTINSGSIDAKLNQLPTDSSVQSDVASALTSYGAAKGSDITSAVGAINTHSDADTAPIATTLNAVQGSIASVKSQTDKITFDSNQKVESIVFGYASGESPSDQLAAMSQAVTAIHNQTVGVSS